MRAYLQKGKIQTEEFIYIHFQKQPNFTILFSAQKTNAFYLTAKGFVPKQTAIIKQTFKQYNNFSVSKEIIDSLRRGVKRKGYFMPSAFRKALKKHFTRTLRKNK